MHTFVHIVYNRQAPGLLEEAQMPLYGPVFVQIKQKNQRIVQRFLRYPSFFEKLA